MFEYPPVGIAKGTPRKHRDYLTKRAGLKEAVPFEDVEIRNQIHLSYRLQYDPPPRHVLPRLPPHRSAATLVCRKLGGLINVKCVSERHFASSRA